jgi:hypothetical protein
MQQATAAAGTALSSICLTLCENSTGMNAREAQNEERQTRRKQVYTKKKNIHKLKILASFKNKLTL